MNAFFQNKIKLIKLKKIKNQKGNILKILDKKNKGYQGFSEVYFSWVKYKAIKAWKFHKKMTMNLVVIEGKIKFVFYDQLRKKFKEIVISKNNYKRIIIRPKIWFGFMGLDKKENIIINLANIMHNKNEIYYKKLRAIKYNWRSK